MAPSQRRRSDMRGKHEIGESIDAIVDEYLFHQARDVVVRGGELPDLDGAVLTLRGESLERLDGGACFLARK